MHPAMVCKPAPSPLGCSLGDLEEYYHRQWPMDEGVFVKIQVSSREIPTHIWSKKIILSLDALEKVRKTVWLYPCYPSPNTAYLNAKRDLSPWILPWGKVREWEWALDFPSCARCCQKCPFLFCPIQRTESWATGLGSWRVADRTLEGH